MTTPRSYALVSRTAITILTLALGACSGTAARSASSAPTPVQASAATLRFDNQGRAYVRVYLVGEKREWLLGRVEPGAVATLRIPEESIETNPGFVQLAVLAGGGVSQAAARDPRAQLTIAQSASSILSRRWKLAQGQLTSLASGSR
jgi:hypothetical protein